MLPNDVRNEEGNAKNWTIAVGLPVLLTLVQQLFIYLLPRAEWHPLVSLVLWSWPLLLGFKYFLRVWKSHPVVAALLYFPVMSVLVFIVAVSIVSGIGWGDFP